MAKIYSIFWLVIASYSPCLSAMEVYQFDSTEQEQQYQRLTRELRCPKCQNQNIADSHAPLSKDLRQKVFEMTKAGKNEQEIKQYLVARYGDFVTYQPPMKPQTWLLWFGPVILFFGVLVVVIWQIKQKQSQKMPSIDLIQQQRLEDILDNHEDEH